MMGRAPQAHAAFNKAEFLAIIDCSSSISVTAHAINEDISHILNGLNVPSAAHILWVNTKSRFPNVVPRKLRWREAKFD